MNTASTGGASAASAPRGPLQSWLMAMAMAAVLAGCATRPARNPALPSISGAPETHQLAREAALALVPAWSLQGRVALSNGRDGGSGRIDWAQDGRHYDVSLSAPITRQSWRLSGDELGAQLEGLEGGTRTGTDPAGLLREATRWEIPVMALSSWVRGLRAAPGEGPAQVRYGVDGRLARIEQGGWTIDYSDWQAGDDGAELPGRLNARRGEASVRLVIDRWTGAADAP